MAQKGSRTNSPLRKFGTVTSIIVMAMTIFVSSAAWATNFRSPFANNSHHIFHWDSLTAEFQNAADWSRINNIGVTDMTTAVDQHSAADVHVVDAFYNKPWGGQYECIDMQAFSTTECKHAHARFDLSDPWGDGTRKVIACHEFGHSVGLGHRTQDCMRGEELSPENNYDQHSKDHINGRY